MFFFDRKLAMPTLKHLDNISQIKQKDELKFRALVKVK